jgi:hypothetical protein
MLAVAFATNKGGVTGPAKFAIDDESIRLQGEPAFEGLMVKSRFFASDLLRYRQLQGLSLTCQFYRRNIFCQ